MASFFVFASIMIGPGLRSVSTEKNLFLSSSSRPDNAGGGVRDNFVIASNVVEKLLGMPTLLTPGLRLRKSSNDELKRHPGSLIVSLRTFSSVDPGLFADRTRVTGTPSIR